MQLKVETPEMYLLQLPEERKPVVNKLRQVVLDSLPNGFEETINYGMLAYVVPHSIYPSGYHCDPRLPLPFMSIASQKNFIALYHMGLYVDKSLMDWFTAEFAKHTKSKLDMGKSCIRFKKEENIPFELIGQLTKKINVQDWISIYESNIKK